MIKRTQNKLAESRIALPVTTVYALGIWLIAGLIPQGWWIPFVFTAGAAYVMVELNNRNALIRIYSRMVSCSFLVLSCACSFLFPSVQAALGLFCFVTFLFLFFHTYQDKGAPGGTFYAFLMMGLASMVHVHVLYLIPLYWLFMLFKIQSFSWRTFSASIFGLILPYWFIVPYYLWKGDFISVLDHFEQLGWVTFPFDYSVLTMNQLLFYALLVCMTIIGSIHFFRTRYKDKIRTRMMFDCFAFTSWICLVLLALQPQHDTLLLPILIACTSPLIAHFLALTYTRWTNIAFFIIIGATLALTVFNLWNPSLHF